MEYYPLTTMVVIYVCLTAVTTWVQVIDQCILYKKHKKNSETAKAKKIKIIRSKKKSESVNFCDAPDMVDQKNGAEHEEKQV